MTIEIKNDISILNSEGKTEKLSELKNEGASKVKINNNRKVKVSPMAAVFQNPDVIERSSDYLNHIVYRK